MKDSCRFIKTPNLPQYAVNTVLIGEGHPEISGELAEYGIKTLELKRNADLNDEVSAHADMLVSVFSDGNFVFSEKDDIIKTLESDGAKVSVISKALSEKYPLDIALNCAILGDKLFGLKSNIADEVKHLSDEQGLFTVNTKQGYAKCSMCIVSKAAVITEDSGISDLLKNSQIDVLLIKGDCITLSDNHNGFLGGCSGKISPDKIYFNGDLSKHSDYKRIIEFINKYSVKPVFSSSRELTDVGGIIPIIEYGNF